MGPRLYLAVAAGGAIGSVARHLCGLGALALGDGALPWGILAVNAAGSLLIGLCATLMAPGGRIPASPALRHFAMAGFCGGFTTFSLFSLETIRMAEAGRVALAASHVGASVVLWLLAALAGHRLAQRLNAAAAR